MTQKDKLLAKLANHASDRSWTFAELDRVLGFCGYALNRVRGSHHIYAEKGSLMKRKLREEDRYAVTVEWSDDDSGFVARVPAMPGCICVMETEASAIKEIRMLIRKFLDIRQQRELRKLQLVAA